MSVIIYRELDPNMPDHVRDWLEARQQLIEILDQKGNSHFIIENDLPRDPEVTEGIVGGGPYGPGCTIGFGVYTDEGERVGMYRTVERAEEAAAKARVVSAESDEGMEWDSIEGDGED